jgi:hypothetical protein
VDIQWLLGCLLVVFAAAMVALARRRQPPGQTKNALSVVLVIFCLIAAFLVFFGFGAAFRDIRTPAQQQSR